MTEPARYLHGPLTRLGLTAAVVAILCDQALKLWLLFIFELGGRGAVRLTPFLDLVLVWNRGISYGLFQQDGPLGAWLLLALKLLVVALLWIWLARAGSRLAASRQVTPHAGRVSVGGEASRQLRQSRLAQW